MNRPVGYGDYGSRDHGSRAPVAESANLADILERVLDKGIVIAGDIRIDLLDIELLTIRLRLLVASVDRAREMGIDWWEHDPSLSSTAARREQEARRDQDARREQEGRREPERLEGERRPAPEIPGAEKEPEHDDRPER
ncbi:gas vesicle protein [Phaeacidiphilus oryzae]|uniref:gas vesicle protein n=1 Tax=Phaeacidiphilus oryzae TaxID=348818 RepID=UPI000A050F7D